MCGWRNSERLRAGLIAAIAVFVAGCAREPSTPAAAKPSTAERVLRVSQRNEPVSLDPATTTLPDEYGILRALLEGLLVPGPDGSAPRPGVAEGFEVSADGLVYTFRLRNEARWSDGEAVTAGDFVAAYRRLLSPETASPKATIFFGVRNARAFTSGRERDFNAVGFRAADPRTLIVTLESPNPRFPHVVASGPWLPVRVDLAMRHGRRWTEPGNFVGNGPFTLEEWRPDQHIALRGNPHWHGATTVALDGIRFVRFDSSDSEERAYRAGQIDVTMAIPASKVPVYTRERTAELHRTAMIETRHLVFNLRRPALNGSTRRALSLAIDRQRLTERVLQGSHAPADTFLPPQLRPAVERGEKLVTFDPAEARRLLAEAGFPGGSGFPRLELSGWTNAPVLEALQQMWREHLGVEVAITLREAKVHLDALRAGGFDIAFATAIPDAADPAAMLGDLVTGAALNYPGWSDPGFDRAVAGGRWAEAEAALLTGAPVAPLYYNTKVWLMSPRVRGWSEDGLWARIYPGVSIVPP
ncbi:MAG: hypothetical protein RJB55_2770 [Verrucomicrobiota bacterium]